MFQGLHKTKRKFDRLLLAYVVDELDAYLNNKSLLSEKGKKIFYH